MPNQTQVVNRDYVRNADTQGRNAVGEVTQIGTIARQDARYPGLHPDLLYGKSPFLRPEQVDALRDTVREMG